MAAQLTRRTPSQRIRLAGALMAIGLSISPVASVALEFSDIATEGQLRFLEKHPDPGSYRYTSMVRISENSLQSGIVELTTCHHQLDPIRKVVIAFNPKRIQSLEIRSASGMESLAVEGHLVVMGGVQRGAEICIDLRSRALDRIDDKNYRLMAGPLMRRYFDGYLPMQATLKFEWPADRVRLKQTNPAPQPGVRLTQGPSTAELDITFAGRLSANIDLTTE